jgi:DNA-directed RNA polymerase specialized sigma24 family protein
MTLEFIGARLVENGPGTFGVTSRRTPGRSMADGRDQQGGLPVERLVAEAYDDLRERVRAMSRGAPPTLAGTAGLHTALERILRRRTAFRDRRHFTAYCLFLIRRLWISRWRATARRRGREAAALLPVLTLLAGEPVVAARDEALSMLELLDRLRGDRLIARRRKIARAVEAHLVAGFTQAETAELLGESKGMVQQRIAFFLAWARLAVAPDLALVVRAVAAAAGDARLGRGPGIAEAARRFYLLGQPRGAIAAALGETPARVEQDLRLFAAWVAAREAKGGVEEVA